MLIKILNHSEIKDIIKYNFECIDVCEICEKNKIKRDVFFREHIIFIYNSPFGHASICDDPECFEYLKLLTC